MLVAISIIGVLLHVLMDLPTSYGTRVLSSFSWRWFAVDWMPIIDVSLLILLSSAQGAVIAVTHEGNFIWVMVILLSSLRRSTSRSAMSFSR